VFFICTLAAINGSFTSSVIIPRTVNWEVAGKAIKENSKIENKYFITKFLFNLLRNKVITHFEIL
jgi:hypothetical protein